MGWTYCDCGYEVDPPTTKELITSNYTCPECGVLLPTGYSEQEIGELLYEVIEELDARIKALETKPL